MLYSKTRPKITGIFYSPSQQAYSLSCCPRHPCLVRPSSSLTMSRTPLQSPLSTYKPSGDLAREFLQVIRQMLEPTVTAMAMPPVAQLAGDHYEVVSNPVGRVWVAPKVVVDGI